ncbi:MAG: DUF932 domain-containing protein [Bacteroidota bacterium]|nr:DUF932 domain-containing protein [Bacteroidota bacterium]
MINQFEIKEAKLDVAPKITQDIEGMLKPYLFRVEEREIAYNKMGNLTLEKSFIRTNSYKGIVRCTDNNLIAVHPRTYKLITNQEVILPLMEQLHQLDNKWVIDPSHSFVQSNRMRLQITFPEITISDDSGNDGVALSWFIHNSYDASEGVRSYWGGIRGICTNGAVFGHLLSKFYHRHTSGFRADNVHSEIEATIERIPLLKERFEILNDMKVKQSDMKDVEKIGKGIHEYAKSNNPENLLALYHLLTWYVSHQVAVHMRAAYQFKISKMFSL